MPFYLNPIGGNWQFYLPLRQEDGQEVLDGDITCHITAPGQPTKNLKATIVTDNNLSFDWIDPEADSAGIPFNTKDIKISCENVRLMAFGREKLNEFETNIALRLPLDTFTVALFGNYYQPFHDHHGRSPAAKFGIFLLVILILSIVIGALLWGYNKISGGKVGLFCTYRIKPCFAKCPCPTFSNPFSRREANVEDDDDIPVGSYGSYANSSLN